MPLLQVRDCPEALYDELRRCAERERRTIAQQNVVILEQYFTGGKPDSENDAPAANRRNREKALEHIDAMGPLETPEGFPSAATLIREDRER